MKDYKKYILNLIGLKESNIINKKDEYPDIDPEKWIEVADKENYDLNKFIKADANVINKFDLNNQSSFISPTAKQIPIIGLSVRGSSSGGLPSKIDQINKNINPSNIGGYEQTNVVFNNTKAVGKTPENQEINSDIEVINLDSSKESQKHPYQIQSIAGNNSYCLTGDNINSDSTLILKMEEPKEIDDEFLKDTSENPRQEEENPMIPINALGETFEKHKNLMKKSLGIDSCPCGCEKGKCKCGPDCKCKKDKMHECSICGCGNPQNDHKNNLNNKNDNINESYSQPFSRMRILAGIKK